MHNYSLSRSNRKTIAIYVRNGVVDVRAPLRMPKHLIDAFVKSKEKWIGEKLEKLNDLTLRRNSFTLSYGDPVAYRGKQYPIVAQQGNRIGFDEKSFYMPGDLTPEQIKYACIQIYRMLAKRDLTTKALAYAQRMSVTPSAVKINSARSRWGSCSSKNSLNFSWMLIMADDELIDYIVVHELAHITELNHSERFWSIVEGILPDHRARRAKLKELQQRLNTEDWA